MLEYLKSFNCVQTIAIFVCKQFSSDSFKNKKNLQTIDIEIIDITILLYAN